MLSIRRAAWRCLSTPSVSFTARSRSIASIQSPSPLRIPRRTQIITFQQRWASSEAKEADPPISQSQPTVQEEVENVIQQDNAARTVESSTEAPSEASQESAETAQAVTENAEPASATFGAETQGSPVDVTQESATSSTQAPESSSTIPTDSYRRRSTRAAESRSSDAEHTPKSTVYIGNLFFDVTEDDLTKELARFGQIQKVKLIRDARGLSKGFGYVSFSSTEEAGKAIANLNQQLFEGRRLNVGYAQSDMPPLFRKPRADAPVNPPSRTLFIGNMSWEMTDRDLNNLFRGIQNVIDVRVAIDRRTGQPRGFAHADFTDVKSAMEAMKQLVDKEPLGRKLRVDYSYGPSNAPRNKARDSGEL